MAFSILQSILKNVAQSNLNKGNIEVGKKISNILQKVKAKQEPQLKAITPAQSAIGAAKAATYGVPSQKPIVKKPISFPVGLGMATGGVEPSKVADVLSQSPLLSTFIPSLGIKRKGSFQSMLKEFKDVATKVKSPEDIKKLSEEDQQKYKQLSQEIGYLGLGMTGDIFKPKFIKPKIKPQPPKIEKPALSPISKELEPLVAEAKKYKSAEEFVNSFVQHATDVPEKIRGGSIEKGMLASNVAEDIASKNPSYFYKTPDGKVYVGKNAGEIKSIFLAKKADVQGLQTIGGVARGEGQLGLKPIAEFPVGTDIKSQLTDLWNKAQKELLEKATKPEAIPPQSQLQKLLSKTEQNIRKEDLKIVSSTGNIAQSPEKVKETTDSIQKLMDALKEVKPVRALQEKLYSKERAKRLARLLSVRGKVGGEKGFYAELGQLKGELPKAQFESLRGKVSQEDIDNLFNVVRDSNLLGDFQKITAREGLAKIFGQMGGQVPTEGELILLNRVFPNEMIDRLLKMRPFLTRFWEGVEQIANIPRSIMSSLDASAPFRQGVFLEGRKEFWKSFGKMFQQMGSEKAYKAVMEDIIKRPTYRLMDESGLALTDIGSVLSQREEKFMSSWAEKIPIAGRFIRASSRAYTGFLNKLRADVFGDILKKSRDAGIETDSHEFLKGLSSFINSSTGRGELGAFERSARLLNAFFFSPRLMASRINMLNPYTYIKLPKGVRSEAIKSLLSFGAISLTIAGLAKSSGADIELDPRNADFLKIKIGNTRIDILGGFQQYIRLGAQLVSGKIVSSTTGKTLTLGEGYKPLTRLDILERFFASKENPIASFFTSWLEGQDVIGEKFELKKEILNRFTPMVLQDIRETMKEQGVGKGLLLSGLGAFGFGVQTYSAKPKKNKGILEKFGKDTKSKTKKPNIFSRFK